eukprot:gnl/Hemi2/23959_TR8037_c0_g8_i1.p2 gnl/Hemi2/23959_TR8037_c0_g8~~gnl/Hemi2/23959_TR8037_c0_g8_i1.p2  ORF type:complete len:101 (-),score=15.49 gnl/Hemi2/23959_TR8037_c0_g8_i1:298-555(-)
MRALFLLCFLLVAVCAMESLKPTQSVDSPRLYTQDDEQAEVGDNQDEWEDDLGTTRAGLNIPVSQPQKTEFFWRCTYQLPIISKA